MKERAAYQKLSSSDFTKDPALAAKAAGLRYVLDSQRGWKRKKRGKSFYYVDEQGEKYTDPATLERIKSLAIPPAWKQVWICASARGHLQATGIDEKGRKQYRYHPAWNQLRNQTKYFTLLDFSYTLPLIRQTISNDLKRQGYPPEKILALIVKILDETGMRIGNTEYYKSNGSFGLTMLNNRHVKVEGASLKFRFKGKKGGYQNISLKNARLARLIRKCQEIPGKELFQYMDQQGKRHTVESGDVNTYLKKITDKSFTAKDFRTWVGTITAFKALQELQKDSSIIAKKRVVQMFDKVAYTLGNTRSICKKYYVHPAIVEACEQEQLEEYSVNPQDGWLSEEELIVQYILNKYDF